MAVIQDTQSLQSNQFRDSFVEEAETPDEPKQPVNVRTLLNEAFIEFEATYPNRTAPPHSGSSLRKSDQFPSPKIPETLRFIREPGQIVTVADLKDIALNTARLT